MAKARRARRSAASVVVPVLVILIAVAAVAIVWKVRGDHNVAGAGVGTTANSSSSAGAPSATATPSETSSPSPSASATGSGSGSAQGARALTTCRTRVRAGDQVVAAADTGAGHWAEHVQAQTDQFAGKISATQMSAIFARTRLAGPADVSRYNAALTAYRSQHASCATVSGSSPEVNSQLAFCGQRLSAQAPMLAAADRSMGDWEHHLADMRRSRMIHVANAEQVWLTTWKKAPPHIRGYAQARAAYAKAPDC